MSVPRVSVILPTYNRASLLLRALTSVLDQTYESYEVRIVDDGSTDNTRLVVAGLADQRLHYERIDHAGSAVARNHAVRTARGEWLAFIDSDDEWMPTKLERQLGVAATLPPEIGVIYCGGEYVDDTTSRPVATRRLRPGRDVRVFDRLLETNWFPFVSVLIHRRCFERVGLFDEGLACGEDREWLLRVARSFDFYGLADPLVRVHIHRGQRQTTSLAERIAFAEAILRRYAEELARRPALRARKYVALGQLQLHHADPAAARRAFMMALRTRPAFLPAYFHLLTSWGLWPGWHAISRLRQRRRGRRSLAQVGGQRTAP